VRDELRLDAALALVAVALAALLVGSPRRGVPPPLETPSGAA
jgi:hypothetical protein